MQVSQAPDVQALMSEGIGEEGKAVAGVVSQEGERKRLRERIRHAVTGEPDEEEKGGRGGGPEGEKEPLVAELEPMGETFGKKAGRRGRPGRPGKKN